MEGAGLEKSVFAFYMPFIVIYDFRISYLQKILKGYNIAFVSFFLLFPLSIKTGSPVRSEFCNPSLAMVTSLSEIISNGTLNNYTSNQPTTKKH